MKKLPEKAVVQGNAETFEIQQIKLTKANQVGGKVDFSIEDGCTIAYQQGEYKLMGNFSVDLLEERRILTEIVDAENKVERTETKIVWRVVVCTENQKFFADIENGKVLDVSNWAARVTASRAWVEDGALKLWRKFMHFLIVKSNYVRYTVFSNPGWKLIDGRWRFVCSDGVIGSSKSDIFAIPGFEIGSNETGITRKQACMEFIGMKQIMPNRQENADVLMYFSLMSVLTRIFQEVDCPIKFSIAVVGKTNSRKTSAALIFSRLYKRKAGMLPDINFTSTEVAIYEAMDKYADSILLVDDLTPAENAGTAREQMKKAELIVRSYGDRVPRKRSKVYAVDKGVAEFSPIRGTCLMTGEIWGGCKSSQSRVIKLNFEDHDVNNLALSHYQDTLEYYGIFMRDFLEYVTENMQAIMEIIRKNVLQARQKTESQVGITTPRYREALGYFEAIAEIFQEFVITRGYLSQQQAQESKERDINAIQAVLCQNDENVKTLAPGIIILAALQTACRNNQVEIKKREELAQMAEHSEKFPQNLLGYDENYYYITAEKLWEIADVYAKTHHFYFPYNSGRNILPLLKNEGVLLMRKEGKSLRCSLHIGIGNNFRCLHLKRAAVEKIWETLEAV